VIKSYYAFKEEPFSRDIAVDDLYMHPGFQTAYERLKHAAKRKLFAVLTGDSGIGKTTVIRRLSESMDINRYAILYLSDSALTPRNFYFETLHQLGITPKFYRGDAKRQLQKALMLLESEEKIPVIIVDEGHLLGRSMLEEIRFLLNQKMDSYSPLCLILVGQSELKDILRMQVNSAIAQRVDFKFHINPFSLVETTEYIKQHLKTAGAFAEIFTQNAIKTIHEHSGGIARKINKLCSLVLYAGASQNQQLIDDHLVRDVIEIEFEW